MKKIDLQLTTESLLGMVSSVTGQYTAIVLVLFFGTLYPCCKED